MDRIQGTDGIRRPVARQDEPAFAGMTPWEVFVNRGVITDAFLEGYAFAFTRTLPPGGEVVVAWDPRDPSGAFTGAVVRGVRKAGVNAVVCGVLPTPVAPMYMVYRGAAAALVVTASHNPPGQNGVKIFLAPAGLKMLPEDDVALTRAVRAVNWEELKTLPMRGEAVDGRAESRSVAREFHRHSRNAWMDRQDRPLAQFALLVDAARGAMTKVAADIFASFSASTQETNADDGSGQVNFRAGVPALEGVKELFAADITGGPWAEYPALVQLAELARAHGREAARGKKFVAGALFDADGDRFYLAVYDAHADILRVLSGDELAVLQAQHLARVRGAKVAGFTFAYTVESDLTVGVAAGAAGFKPVLKAVGDKWLLAEAWRAVAGLAEVIMNTGDLNAALAPKFAAGKLPPPEEIPFAIGVEETGHCITFGALRTKTRGVLPFAAGNGLKAATNALAAIAALARELPPAKWADHVAAPFAPGLKLNEYVFFTRKELLTRGGKAHAAMNDLLAATLPRAFRDLRWEQRFFPEEPDLIYWAGYDSAGAQVLGVFCRNSGTEDKSALYVRAAARYAEEARAVREEIYPSFYALIKNGADDRTRAQLAWLAGGPRADDGVVGAARAEGLWADGRLTDRGRAVLAACRAAKII